MTGAAIASVLSLVGLAAIVPFAGAASESPWWIAAIVLPLAGFAAWLVRYILDAQKTRDAIVNAREERREEREEKRAEQSETQTRAMQECVAELRSLNAAQAAVRSAVDEIPTRVVARLEQRKTG